MHKLTPDGILGDLLGARGDRFEVRPGLWLQTTGRWQDSKASREQLTSWVQGFVGWAAVYDRYAAAHLATRDGDTGWWGGERAQIGFLHAGFWSAGGCGMEEYACDKRRHGKPGGGTSPGRADLYVKIDGIDFAIEAKVATTFIGTIHAPRDKVRGRGADALRETAISDARTAMVKAAHDAGRNTEGAKYTAAVTFVLPWIKTPDSAWARGLKGADAAEAIVTEFRDAEITLGATSGGGRVLRADYLPTVGPNARIGMRRTWQRDQKGRGWYIPGVTALVHFPQA